MIENLILGRPVTLVEGDQFAAIYQDTTLEHPGLAVVDINGDGADDLYVTFPIGTNMLLRNNGDGTFTDTAAELG